MKQNLTRARFASPFSSSRTIIPAALLILGLLVTYFLYSSILGGSFLFDDFSNLNKLGMYGGVTDVHSAIQYLLSGGSSLGRPISYATFLLADNAWPSAPYLFKYHNLMIHLLTGCLTVWLGYLLAIACRLEQSKAAWLGLLTGMLWILHPLQVSTVAYVVQRMAMLSGLFIFAGLILYTSGRLHLYRQDIRGGYWRITLSMVIFFPAAVLSKENGALLPAFMLLLNATLLRDLSIPDRKIFRYWKYVFLYFPLLVLIAYFTVEWQSVIMEKYAKRDFTLAERLLSQPRVIASYIYDIVIPKMQTGGLYHDNFRYSTGLFSPPSTLLSILLIAGLLVIGFVARKRSPVLSFGIFFYFIGHLIESTFIPLELYFEHRNYFPIFGIIFFVAYVIVRMATAARMAGAITAAIVLVSMFSMLTYMRSTLWSDLEHMTMVWVERNPGSLRAQQQAAIIWTQYGQHDKARRHLELAIEHNPNNAVLRTQLLTQMCTTGVDVSDDQLEITKQKLQYTTYSGYAFRQLRTLLDAISKGKCPSISYVEYGELVDSALKNIGIAHIPAILQDLGYLKGMMHLKQGNRDKAFEQFVKTLRIAPNIEVSLQTTGVLATHGMYHEALETLDMAEAALKHYNAGNTKAMLLNKARNYNTEIDRLRKVIRAEMAQ